MGSLSTTVAVVVLVATLATVSGNYFTYLKVGHHARQMQAWKQGMRHILESWRTVANDLREDTMALNESVRDAMNQVQAQATGMNDMTDHLLTKLFEGQANSSALPLVYEAPPVAFQAYVRSNGIQPLAVTYNTLKYSNVVLNDGDHYSAETGLFTAPVTGLYWFHATFKCGGNNIDHKRQVYIKKTMATGGTENIAYLNFYQLQETATTIVTLMHPGDKMGIYPMESTFDVWDIPGGAENTFAGYLVARYDDPDYTPGSTAATTAAADTSTTTV